ncbi:MAG: sigma-54 dependent transcriptional regulator [Holosporales bacterium]|jgi:two-component system nitrogen regulation response regulator NtrX|nr:sigma-54 dependent transcriptional regulator [Holosporales bacterium]
MVFNILIVDDETDIRELVSGILNDNGYVTDSVGSYIEASEFIRKKRPNLVILDVWLGEGDRDGLRLLDFIKKEYNHLPVIMMSGHGTIETAVSAIKKGAYDFIEKPFNSARLITSVEKAIETLRLKMENDELKIKAKVCDGILGKSQNVIGIKRFIEKIAPLDETCLIIGPIGSDKESIAKEIHRLSQRSKNEFGILNCRSYTPRQLESELFGAEIRANDAPSIKYGFLEKVNRGTLFIDELSVISLELQLKILRMIKENFFFRIGSSEKILLNARLIVGSSQNVEQLVTLGKFNKELYYRLNSNLIKVLPLKSRKEDISYLLEHFMTQTAKANNTTPKRFSNEAISLLNSYSWPGDVIQMKNMVDWLLAIKIAEEDNNEIISPDNLPKEIFKTETTIERAVSISMISELSIKDAREAFEREYFMEQLKRFSGNISQTAKFVGMERTALHRKLKSLNIPDLKLFKDN